MFAQVTNLCKSFHGLLSFFFSIFSCLLKICVVGGLELFFLSIIEYKDAFTVSSSSVGRPAHNEKNYFKCVDTLRLQGITEAMSKPLDWSLVASCYYGPSIR